MEKNQEIERLREELNRWLVEEENDNDEAWLKRGEAIFQRFNQLEPENTKFKIWFAQMLRDYGRDIKLRKENYRKARKLFEQALRVEPDDPVCCDHLGHLELYDGRWREAIRQFQLVLRSTSKRLEPYHYIRALCSSAIAYNQLGDPEKALRLLEEAKERDSERLYRTEIDNVRLQVKVWKKTDVEEEDLPFRLIEKNTHSYVTYGEACRLAEEDEMYVILDIRRGDAVLHGPCDSVRLPYRLAKLLQCLLKAAPSVKEHNAIRTEVWGDGGDVRDDVVKKMINKLRERLKPCFSEPMDHIIVNVRGRGYRWECEIPYRIIVPSDDYECII
jgi:DNA-binding winged helix-turn-helix (wHTH) protein